MIETSAAVDPTIALINNYPLVYRKHKQKLRAIMGVVGWGESGVGGGGMVV